MIPYYILAIENDDDRAFMEDLYRNYNRLMYSEIFKLVRDPWATEDLMQSVLIKLIDKLSLLRNKPRKPLINYIISTCKNTARNYLRDHGRNSESSYENYLEVFSTQHDGHEMERKLIKAEELDCLTRIWPKLDERTRSLLEGYYILEKPMAKLAAELGIKPDSARMALSRARQKAYDLLENELEGSR